MAKVVPPVERDFPALLAFIRSRLTMPHRWGREANDCCSFPLQAIEAMTGRKPRCKLSWATRRGALRILKRAGGLETAIDLHFVRIPPAQAQRGDIAGVLDPHLGLHPMIVEGETLVGPGEQGLRRMRRDAMVMAWSATEAKMSPVIASRTSPGRAARR